MRLAIVTCFPLPLSSPFPPPLFSLSSSSPFPPFFVLPELAKSNQVRWAHGSTNTPQVASLSRELASTFAAAKARHAAGVQVAEKAGRDRETEKLPADVRKILVLMHEMHALALENSGREKRQTDRCKVGTSGPPQVVK